MRTSIAEFLEREGVLPENTVYREMDKPLLYFPVICGDFLKLVKNEEVNESFHVMRRYRKHIQAKREEEVYCCFTDALEKIREILAYIEQLNKETEGHPYRELIIFVRSQKKILEERKERLNKKQEADSAGACFGITGNFSQYTICYKNVLYITSWQEISALLKPLRAISYESIKKTPLFTTSVKNLQKAAAQGEPLGIIGGPCLLGYDELTVQVIHQDGTEFYFDYSGKKSYEENEEKNDRELLGQHLNRYKKEIAEIGFFNKKSGITAGEYDSLNYLFEFASVLNAKVIIPVPDMSYRKFLSAVCEVLDTGVAARAESLFQKIVYKMTDMYLMWIERLKKQYPSVCAEVLHERNQILCSLFYKERESYYQNYSKKEYITSNKYNRESVIDYIMMPAMPFYRWGIKEVIQIDCISETDSYRKCIKMHKDAFHLHGIFYPEHLSKDGIHTIYSAENCWKEYRYL